MSTDPLHLFDPARYQGRSNLHRSIFSTFHAAARDLVQVLPDSPERAEALSRLLISRQVAMVAADDAMARDTHLQEARP